MRIIKEGEVSQLYMKSFVYLDGIYRLKYSSRGETTDRLNLREPSIGAIVEGLLRDGYVQKEPSDRAQAFILYAYSREGQ